MYFDMYFKDRWQRSISDMINEIRRMTKNSLWYVYEIGWKRKFFNKRIKWQCFGWMTSKFYGNDKEIYRFMIGKISLMQILYVIYVFCGKGSMKVLCGYLWHEVGNLRQLLSSLDYTTSSNKLLILMTSADGPWFTIPIG